MKMTPEEFLNTGLLEEYVLGLLTDAKADKVQAYIAKHPSIENTYIDMQTTVSNLAKSHGIIPPAQVKSKVMQSIGNSNRIIIPKENNWLKYVTSAIAIILGIISIISYNTIKSLATELKMEKKAYAELSSDCEKNKEAYETSSRIYAFYKDPNTQSAILKGNEKAPNFELVSHYNKTEGQIALNISSGTDLPNNKMLCLWGDVKGEMILIAKLDPSIQDKIIPFDKNMTSLNVTIEDTQDEINHPDVSQLIASNAI